MDDKRIDEQAIKAAVAERAAEFGYHIHPEEVTLSFRLGKAAPGCVLFHARWGGGQREGTVSGLLVDDEPPDTYPAQALAKVYRRWLEVDGKLPDAALAAEVSNYLYDSAELFTPILNAKDRTALVQHAEWLPYVHLPQIIEEEAQPGVAFWRAGPPGLSEIRFILASGGQIRTDEKYIHTFLKG